MSSRVNKSLPAPVPSLSSLDGIAKINLFAEWIHMRFLLCLMLWIGCLSVAGQAHADGFSSFLDFRSINPTGISSSFASSRLYLSGIGGVHLDSIKGRGGADRGWGNPNGWKVAKWDGEMTPLLETFGVAAGVDLGSSLSLFRLEIEGRWRGSVGKTDQVYWVNLDGDRLLSDKQRVTEVWSAMVNVWKDFELSAGWSMSAGGGIGVLGYRNHVWGDAGSNQILWAKERFVRPAFQIGGGPSYALSDGVSIDITYRYFQQIGTQPTVGVQRLLDAENVHYGYYRTTYSSNELLATIRADFQKLVQKLKR